MVLVFFGVVAPLSWFPETLSCFRGSLQGWTGPGRLPSRINQEIIINVFHSFFVWFSFSFSFSVLRFDVALH